jgi:hypothetical protein
MDPSPLSLAVLHSHPSISFNRHNIFLPGFFPHAQQGAFFPNTQGARLPSSQGAGLSPMAGPLLPTLGIPAATPFFPNSVEQRLPSPSSASPSRREEQTPSSASSLGQPWRGALLLPAPRARHISLQATPCELPSFPWPSSSSARPLPWRLHLPPCPLPFFTPLLFFSPWSAPSSSAPLLFFPVVAILRRAASRSMPWPDLPPPWTPLAVPCAQLSLSSAPHFLPWKTNSEPPSSLFVVVPAGCSAKCAASRALQQHSRSISTPLVACRRSRARCAAPSATPSKIVLVVDAALRALPVRWDVEPCGQPMRLVTTRSC